MAQHVYGIDLGTSNIKMYSSSSDNILNEKNVIAIKNKNEIFSFGNQAFEMYEKAPENINVSFPVKFGVIADIKNMETLFSCFYKKLNGGKTVNGADYCIAVPTDVTEVEKRAFYDVILDAKLKAKNITVVEKPIADAVGMGIDVQSPNGHMIVDIGSDTTEISVISLGGIVLSKLIKTGGSKFDEAICGIVRKKYNLIIGSRSAEQIKMQLADAIEPDEDSIKERWADNQYTQITGSTDELHRFADESFDMIICHNVLEYAKDRENIIKEFARILKPDGKISIVKHNRAGRVMQMVVLLNDFEHAQSLLDGNDGMTSKYGAIHYYEDSDIEKWCLELVITKTLGMRTFWDLQQNQEIHKDADWQEKMVEIEMRVSDMDGYKDIAFFHHLMIEKK